jgi:hypothetical protein
LTSITVSPASPVLSNGAQQQMTATGYDQFGGNMTTQPTITWSLPTGTGQLSSTGLYTAPASNGTFATVKAANGSPGTVSGTTVVTVPGLVDEWKFNDGSGTSASDSVGGHSGAVNGASWTAGTVYGGALAFNGVSNTVTFGTGPSLTGTTDFTLSAWVKTTATTQGTIIQQRDANGFNGEYQLYLDASGKINFMIYGNNAYEFSSNLTSSQAVNDGNWHCIVAERQAGAGRIYVDGNLVASRSGTAQPLAGTITVTVGEDIRDGANFFNGTINDVRIYSYALNASQAAALAVLAPSVTAQASASPSTVTGTSAALTVAATSNYYPSSSLIYSWTATSVPSGASAPTFSPNGSNAAQNTTASFSAAGPYVLKATVTDGSGRTATSSVNVTVNQTFSTWQAQTFGSNANNSSIAGPTANPSGDGVVNLLKYAFNLNPLTPNTGELPSVVQSGGNLLLTYLKNDAATDLTYTVLQSTDMVTWTPASATLTTLSDTNGTSTIQAGVPVNGATNMWVRLSVTQQ